MAGDSARRTLLVGFDGIDWQILRPLLDRGELPHFARLIMAGASGRLSTLEPTLSPILWNSIATGKRAGKHGIHGFTEVDSATGAVRPVSSTSRTCKAVWNILQQNGRRANVVNWFAGHPAEPLDGVAVSPLFFEGSAGPGTIHPADLAKEWAGLRVKLEEVDGEIGRLFVRDIATIDQDKDRRLGQLAGELAKTFSIQTVAIEAMQRRTWDFTAVYFRFTDILAHLFMPFHPPQAKGIPDDLFHHYQDVVNSSYRLADLLLGNLCLAAGEDTTVMVLSDHGFATGDRRPQVQADPFANVEEWHREHGVLIVSGPGIRPGFMVTGAGLLDITPTLLTFFGLPLARDMDGRALLEILAAPKAPEWIESWDQMPGRDGRHAAGTQLPEADATAMLAQLQALGYIAPLGSDKVAAARQTQAQNKWNLARDFLDAGADEAALPLLEELHAEQSGQVSYTITLAGCQSRLGLHTEARLTAGDARRLVPEGRMLSAVLGSIAMQAGAPDEALQHFSKLVASGPVEPALHVEIARAHLAGRAWAAARAACAAALALEPDFAPAHLTLARAALREGLPAEAATSAMAAIARQQNMADAHLVLGRALRQLDRNEDAIPALEAALVYNPALLLAHQELTELYHRHRQDIVGEMKHRLAAQKIEEAQKQGPARIARLRAEVASRRAGREGKIWGKAETIEALEADARRDVAARLEGNPAPAWKLEPGREFVVVSGLPRSGTSVMMQMLAAGGLPAMTDGERVADEDNPEGYYEWAEIMRLAERPWVIEQAHGRAVKIVAPLLAALPPRHRYRVIFMERPAAEIARSQEKMLGRRGQALPPDLRRIADVQTEQAGQIAERLAGNPLFSILRVPYTQLVDDPAAWAARVAEFVQPVAKLGTAAMAGAVKPSLYRNRGPAA